MAATGLAVLACRYARARAAADRDWAGRVEARLADLGEVDAVSILPLVERLTSERPDMGLKGEAGLSYLVQAGASAFVIDTGLNVRGAERSPLGGECRCVGR